MRKREEGVLILAGICAKYWDVLKVQIKLGFIVHLGCSLLVLLLTPVIFGIKNLDAIASSFVLERFVALIGIILITPLFLPEQNPSVQEISESKYTSLIGIYLVRLCLAIAATILLVGVFLVIMQMNMCSFPTFQFWIGTFATAFGLGSLGFMSYALSENLVVGYLVPSAFYLMNLVTGSKLGYFYLFSLSINQMLEKYIWLAMGIGLIVIGLVFRYFKRITR